MTNHNMTNHNKTNHHKIKLIALDLDGTLLHEDKSISPDTLRIIQALADRGITIVPATGRNLPGIQDNILQVQPIQYAICSNGANIIDLSNGGLLYSFPIPAQDAVNVITYLQQFPTVIYLHTDQGTIRSKNWNDSGLAERFPYIQFHENNEPDLTEYIQNHSVKIWKIGVFVLDDQIFEQLLSNGSPIPQIVMNRTGECNIELNCAEASKGNALKTLCDYLDLSLEETLAIGDNQNDLEILGCAGVSVAMGNAGEDVKAAADYVAGTNDEDGAAVFLREFFGL